MIVKYSVEPKTYDVTCYYCGQDNEVTNHVKVYEDGSFLASYQIECGHCQAYISEHRLYEAPNDTQFGVSDE